MHIQIETEPLGALRVISGLPAARLSILEGLNGIGKTLAIRLLQICTGRMPYRAGSPAWTSLCRGLGEFRVTISDLVQTPNLEFVADTREWLDQESVSHLQFKRRLIGGKPSSLADVRQSIRVHRLAGDETLIETLAQHAESAEDTVRRWIRNTANVHDSPLALLEKLATEVHRALGDWTGERYEKLVELAQSTEKKTQDLNNLLQANAESTKRVSDAEDLRRRAQELRNSAPDLNARATKIDGTIATKRDEIADLQRQMTPLALQAAKRGPALEELKNAQRTLRRNQENLSKYRNRAATAAAELGIEPNRAALSALNALLNHQLAELSKQRIEMDAAPAMRGLLDELSTRLADGESRGLAEQIALDDPEINLQLTVTETRVGIVTRRAQLEGQPPPPDAKEVIDQLSVVQHRIQRTVELGTYLNNVDRYKRLVSSSEERVDDALTAANPKALAELQRLESRRRELDSELLELAAERAVLRQQLSIMGNDSLAVVESRLHAITRELKIAPSELGNALEEAHAIERRTRAALEDLRSGLAGLRREQARAEADIKRTLRGLAPNGDFAWLSSALNLPALAQAAPLEKRIAGIDQSRRRVEAVADRLGLYRTQLDAIVAALRGVARHLRGQEAEAVEYVSELEDWLGTRFAEWFNTAAIRSELMPEAEGPISVDVHEREVRWTEAGHSRSRPLEAFSSGEQAFAYTRARLAALDDEPVKTANRLIVLDEFGAFIAHDRLLVLLEYLRGRASAHARDQILVVLPLSHDYAKEVRGSIGDQKQEVEDLARQVQERGYAVRILAK